MSSASTGANARPTIEPVEVFATRWTVETILVGSRAAMAGALARFDFSWFIPAQVKYRRLLGEVLLISFMLQIFGLTARCFFQVAMDKVLVHKGIAALDVLPATGPKPPPGAHEFVSELPEGYDTLVSEQGSKKD